MKALKIQLFKTAFAFLFALIFSGFTLQAQEGYDKVHYGKKIEANGASSLNGLIEEAKAEDGKALPMEAKVEGKVRAVCQKKGCWMKMETSDGEAIRVTFKDYGFFVPKDLAGRSVAMAGKLYHDTVCVKVRRHYARDEGKPEEEVKKITEPSTRLAFKAAGVKILPAD